MGIDRVEWGCVTKVYIGNTVYLIYGPTFNETAHKVAERLKNEGYEVVLLNEANDFDSVKADELRKLALQQDC